MMILFFLQVYGIGYLYIQNNTIWGIDARATFYYLELNWNYTAIMSQVKSFLSNLSYDVSSVLNWPETTNAVGNYM
jgi:hypothetical protein